LGTFDIYVKKISEYIEGMLRRQRQVRKMNHPGRSEKLIEGLTVRVGVGAQPGVILKEDTCVELGNLSTAACAFVLWTKDITLIKDGKITLIGSDINESIGKSLPFGQVLILGGADLSEEHQTMLEWTQYISDRIEGYMIRSVPQRIWSRVSKEAAGKGFCFETLGRALMGIFKSELPMVEAMEILFVTSSKEDVEELGGIAIQVEKIAREIKRGKFAIADDGAYVCSSGLDCSVCSDKPICDDIRELISLRKADARSALEGRDEVSPSP
jgi:CO dehydrogenase/acetyl-CoA synthase beta subunit